MITVVPAAVKETIYTQYGLLAVVEVLMCYCCCLSCSRYIYCSFSFCFCSGVCCCQCRSNNILVYFLGFNVVVDAFTVAVAFVAVVDNSAFAAVDVVANVGVVASTDVTIETVAAVADVAIKAVVAVGVVSAAAAAVVAVVVVVVSFVILLTQHSFLASGPRMSFIHFMNRFSLGKV